MNKPYHIVFTTIYHPLVLNELFDNISKYKHLDDTLIWVVGDNKTPDTVKFIASEISEKGLEVKYLDILEQDKLSSSYKEFYDRIPFNNETRRNIGYLESLKNGCEILISIDDDNFPLVNEDFVGVHSKTGTNWQGSCISEKSGFHNICEHLKIKPERDIYPRGFPFHLRGQKNENCKNKINTVIGVTAGLWLKEPDIDATTWLNGTVSSFSYEGEKINVLSQDTWTPINTQNTSVVRDLIPAYLCVPMGWDVPGGKINRYGDIWGGYFLQALIKGLNYNVAFGHPLVEHRRNPHNYLDDLRHEYWGMMLTDWLLNSLKNKFEPQNEIVLKRVFELADFLDTETNSNLPEWCPKEMSDFMKYTADNLRFWAKACENII